MGMLVASAGFMERLWVHGESLGSRDVPKFPQESLGFGGSLGSYGTLDSRADPWVPRGSQGFPYNLNANIAGLKTNRLAFVFFGTVAELRAAHLDNYVLLYIIM